MSKKRQYVCRVCGVTFDHYKGVKTMRGSGIGYCQEHKPKGKE